MEKKKEIRYDSPEAAKEVTVTGWASSEGLWYGKNEHLARWSGCTHVQCSCGNWHDKMWILCDDCRHKKTIDRYNAMPVVEWDGATPVVIFDTDQYFFNEEDIEEYLQENDMQSSDIRLCLCEPQYAHSIDSEYWNDILPQDGDIPEALQNKLNEVNEIIKTLPALSWIEGKERIVYSSTRD